MENGRRWEPSNANKHTWLTLSILAAALIIKSALYRQWTGMDAALSMGQTVTAYIAVTAASLGLATLAWLSRRWPTIVLLILADIWFISGIWYYNANMLWVSWQAVSTISEINGFGSSILSYLAWKQLWFPMTTLLTTYGVLSIPKHRIPPRRWFIAYAITVLLGIGAWIGRLFFPLNANSKKWSFRAEQTYFICTHSPLAQIGLICYEAIQDGLFNYHAMRPLTPREQSIMATIYRPAKEANMPKGHLVFVLVESWESWTLQARDRNGQPVCPHLNAYLETHPVLFVPAVETQQKYGRSGDGQLITQTGLLPISFGVACQRYGENTYPNLAHFYADGVILNPYLIPVWNQNTVTYSYGFKRQIKPRVFINFSDSIIMHQAIECLTQANEPMAVLALTIDMHAPFHSHCDSLELDDSYSATEQDYLRSTHYTDRQIGRFLSWADTAKTMQNATIVLTADHNHFPKQNGHGLCPLIVAAPCVKEPIVLPSALQMDIYPTVLHAIGQSNYVWQGFGVDLIAPDAGEQLEKRPITPTEAYSLSDKLIRTNFFAHE